MDQICCCRRGAGALALMKYAGIDDPGVLSRGFIVPSALLFSAGEAAKVLGECAIDRRNGEASTAKNIAYAARIAAPLYAAWCGSNGVWEPGKDVAIPVISWVAGTGLTELGKKAVLEEKKERARDLYDLTRNTGWIASSYFNDIAADETKNPYALPDSLAQEIPLNRIENSINLMRKGGRTMKGE